VDNQPDTAAAGEVLEWTNQAAALLATSQAEGVQLAGQYLASEAGRSGFAAWLGEDRKAVAAAAIDRRNPLIRGLAASEWPDLSTHGQAELLSNELSRYRVTRWRSDRVKPANPHSPRTKHWHLCEILRCVDRDLAARTVREILADLAADDASVANTFD